MNAARTQAVEAARAAIAHIDMEIATVKRDAADRLSVLRAERRELSRAVDALAGTKRATKRAGDRAIAGPGAIEKVEKYLRKRGTAYQSEVVRVTKLNSGTVTHALRALAEDGKIVATPNVRNRSRQYAYVGGGRKTGKVPVGAAS